MENVTGETSHNREAFLSRMGRILTTVCVYIKRHDAKTLFIAFNFDVEVSSTRPRFIRVFLQRSPCFCLPPFFVGSEFGDQLFNLRLFVLGWIRKKKGGDDRNICTQQKFGKRCKRGAKLSSA